MKDQEFKLEQLSQPGSSFKDQLGGGGERNDSSPRITPSATPTSAAVHVPSATQPIVAKTVQIDPLGAEPGGYSAVNVLSILPDDVRTEENLKGGSLPVGQAHQMITDYKKQRQEYEERELKKAAAAAAAAAASSSFSSSAATGGAAPKQPSPSSLAAQTAKPKMVKTLNFAPGYEDMEPPSPGYDMVVPISKSGPTSTKGNVSSTQIGGGGEYEDPADAVHHDIGVHKLQGGAVVAPKSQISPDKPKKFQLATSLDLKYTDVYNPGDGETIGQPTAATKRAISESTRNRVVNGNHSPGKLAHHYQNTAGVGEGTTSSGDSLDDLPAVMDRADQVRGSKKHKSAKEEVKFDPSKKVFRMTSTRKKQAVNGRDFPDQGGDSTGDSSPDAKMSEKEKQFNLSDENSGGEEYSIVNMADKSKYRTEDDVIKKEGSGVPQRYSAKLPLQELQ